MLIIKVMKKKSSYSYEELIDCGQGKLFGKGNAKLPLPPMLMFDKISEISENSGKFKQGFISAELSIKPDLWFFNCHFKEDPVMPGCLGLDAMWQLVGFFFRMERRTRKRTSSWCKFSKIYRRST